MKKINLVLFSLVMIGLFGCSKTETPSTSNNANNNNNGGGGNNTPTYFFTCKVNGVATDFKAMTLVKDNPANPQQVYLIGAKSNSEMLPSLTFTLNYKAPGWVDGLSYTLDEKDLVNFVEYKNEKELIFKSIATPASVNTSMVLHFDKMILPKDQYASGTFSGSLQLEENVTSVIITEGKFKVQFLN